jgi:hypothetical protein
MIGRMTHKLAHEFRLEPADQTNQRSTLGIAEAARSVGGFFKLFDFSRPQIWDHGSRKAEIQSPIAAGAPVRQEAQPCKPATIIAQVEGSGTPATV